TEEYLELVERLSQQGLPSQVSLKPTLLGLRVSEGVAAEHIEEVVVCAGRRRISVCIDMEDSSTTDATLNIFRRLREAHAHVGVAIQAYLRRSEADLVSLLPLRPSVRVCKGIYREPLGLVIEGRQAVRESYLRLVKLLLDGGGFPALATHDPWLVDQSLRLLEARRQDPGSYELQMLLGVGEALRPKILATGAQLRIYCPYGPDWYAYSLRRLQENPHMVGYVLKAAFSPRILRRGHLSGPGSSGAADPAGA
ncbi:MAG: proline dehydrogenase family protein, partial [Planctomycetes bacterium]|nr:proline dehydrogenase family protein [Planctomycetota bacterium]